MNTFVQRHRDSVTGVLSGFDRVRLRGSLRWLCYADGLGKYLSCMGVLLKDFSDFVGGVTSRIRQAAEQIAASADRPMEYLASSSLSKEERARAIAERDGIDQGLKRPKNRMMSSCVGS